MRRVIYSMMLLVFCTGVKAQNDEAKRKKDSISLQNFETSALEFDEEDSIALTTDTTITTTTTESAESTMEEQMRQQKLPHSLWDDQVPGEWNDVAQGRLSRQKVPADKMEELRNMKALQYTEQPREENMWMQSIGAWVLENIRFFRNLFYLLLGALLLAVIVLFIRKNDISLFRRSHQQQEAAEIFAEQGRQNYDALAKAAIAAGNWREAVRMRYLHSLQLLEAKQLIAPGKDKTNMDYLRELASTAWHKPFARLTLHYEYVWYGQQPLNNGQFSQLDEQFSAFKKSLR